MLGIIGLIDIIGSFSTFLYSFGENFDYISVRHSVLFFCCFRLITNWLVLSICKHFSLYLSLFIITNPLPLSAFKIPISLLSDSSLTNFLYLYGAFILVYLSHVFLSFVLISCNSFSEMLEMSFSKL